MVRKIAIVRYRRQAGSGPSCPPTAVQVDTAATCARLAEALDGWTVWILWRGPRARLVVKADDNRSGVEALREGQEAS